MCKCPVGYMNFNYSSIISERSGNLIIIIISQLKKKKKIEKLENKDYSR